VLATPFTGPGLAVDEDSLHRQVRLFAEVGATGLVVLGVFGEAAALDAREQSRVVGAVASEATLHAGDLPFVVGLAARSTAVAVEQARTAVAASGRRPAGLMVQVHSSDPDVLAAHLRAVHDTTGVGVVVQDYPVVSGVRIGPAQVLATLDRCPFVVAVKSEAPPTAAAIAALTAASDIPVFGGLGGVGLLDELAAGAAGAMTGFSHPEGLRAALRAWDSGGFPAARAAFAPWLPLVNFEAQPGIGLALRKEILRRRGVLADAAVRPPAPPVPPHLLELVDAHLAALPAEVVR
jgi:4-hydroxy-tetrahydrodipicolinate synthase